MTTWRQRFFMLTTHRLIHYDKEIGLMLAKKRELQTTRAGNNHSVNMLCACESTQSRLPDKEQQQTLHEDTASVLADGHRLRGLISETIQQLENNIERANHQLLHTRAEFWQAILNVHPNRLLDDSHVYMINSQLLHTAESIFIKENKLKFKLIELQKPLNPYENRVRIDNWFQNMREMNDMAASLLQFTKVMSIDWVPMKYHSAIERVRGFIEFVNDAILSRGEIMTDLYMHHDAAVDGHLDTMDDKPVLDVLKEAQTKTVSDLNVYMDDLSPSICAKLTTLANTLQMDEKSSPTTGFQIRKDHKDFLKEQMQQINEAKKRCKLINLQHNDVRPATTRAVNYALHEAGLVSDATIARMRDEQR